MELGAHIRGTAPTGETPPLLTLPIPDSLARYPEIPLLAGFDESLLYEGLEVSVAGDWIPLIDLEPVLTREAEDRCTLRLEKDNAEVWQSSIELDGWIRVEGEDLRARWPNVADVLSLSDLLNEYSVPLYFADGSVVTANQIHHPPAALPPFASDKTIRLDWSETDIRKEAGVANDGQVGVQERVIAWITEQSPDSIVLRDDGSGEIADLIAFRREGATVNVDLFHCKWSTQGFAGHRLLDIHDVVCQAARSVRWARAQVLWQELATRLDHRSYTELRVGDPEETRRTLAAWADAPPRTEFTIYVVQPGLQLNEITDWPEGSNLLTSCQTWILDQAAADFFVVGS